jgi:hypothetical protein
MIQQHRALRMALAVFLIPFSTLLLSACSSGGNGDSGPRTPPSKPSGVAATPGDASVSVTWDPVNGATSYNVYMASVAGVTPSNYSTLPDGAREEGATSPYTRTGSTNGTTYYFVVTAANQIGEGLESDAVSATPLAGIRSFSPTASMTSARFGHTATLLPDGKVLMVGGYDGSQYLPSADVYDPATHNFTVTDDMKSGRYRHTATLLNDNTVLVVGGSNGSALANAEIYDPATDTFSDTGSMSADRYGHTATRLQDGTVLIAGGFSGASALPAEAEIYEPATRSFSTKGSMGTPRYGHTASLQPNGTVLITGGTDLTRYLDTAEIYDPATGTFTAVATKMTALRAGHTATLLQNDTVLIAGGLNGIALATAEIFDPATGTFTPTGPTGDMSTARFKHTATLLSNGTVLMAGGVNTTSVTGALPSAEIYDPLTGTFTAIGTIGNMRANRFGHTATLLSDDTTLLVAGGHNGQAPIVGAELFQ